MGNILNFAKFCNSMFSILEPTIGSRDPQHRILNPPMGHLLTSYSTVLTSYIKFQNNIAKL